MKFIPKNIPTTTGVYLFKNKSGDILYIGKAINLRNRIKSYFNNQDNRPKVKLLVPQIEKIETIELNSEFEALIIEASLIKKHQPRFNTIAKDDKQPLYIAITKESFPKVKLVRRSQEIGPAELYGPFPSSYTVRQVLKFIRKIFPYCSCKSNKNRPCLYASIGLCNPCPRKILKLPPEQQVAQKKQYQKQMRLMGQLLSGQTPQVLKKLKKEMNQSAKQKKYELAAYYRDGINQLEYLLQVSKKFDRPHLHAEYRQLAIDQLQQILNRQSNLKIKSLNRIEGYDISTLNGQYSTGSMVVFENGLPQPDQYRQFKIKNPKITQTKQPNDVAMMAEVFTRRFAINHQKTKNPTDSPKLISWAMPDLIVVDGGKPQISTVLKILQKHHINIPLIGLAKKFEEIYIPSSPTKPKNTNRIQYQKLKLAQSAPALHILQHLRDEAHRFANKYRKTLISKNQILKH